MANANIGSVTAKQKVKEITDRMEKLQSDQEIMREQEKESLLLIQNSNLSKYSLIYVRGMDAADIVEALSTMNDDRLSVAAYLESSGAWTTEIANEKTREFREYHLDVRYNVDTKEITDIKKEMAWNKMLPLAKEREQCFRKAELAESSTNRETQLLYGNTDKYGIYQLKDNPELYDFHFEGTESLKRRGIIKDNLDAIKLENYNLVYVGELSKLSEDYIGLQTQGDKLEALYEKFNIDHPADYEGHSLSVSDIVVLHENGQNSAHYVDSTGFTGLPDFLREMEDIKEQEAEMLEFEDTEDGDEIIDLGNEKDKVLVEMKKFLAEDKETELAFQIADRFISIQEVEGGYDYSIMGADYKEIDGGVYDNPDISIKDALNVIVEDLKENSFNDARGNISDKDELIPIDYDELMGKIEAADRIEPQAQGSVVEQFKEKTNMLFHKISEMSPTEIEETVKCHVRAQLDECGINAEIGDVAVVGSRCRGLEREESDLDVVVELFSSEREDVLFDALNADWFHIGGVKVDINPITVQRTGTLETYLPAVEKYLEEMADYKSSALSEIKATQRIEQRDSATARNSLKARLEEKKALVSGNGNDCVIQQKIKKDHKEM